jgi:galactokinase
VSLIGDHTDYVGGLVLPMAIDRWTEIRATPLDGAVRLRSPDGGGAAEHEVRLDLPLAVEPTAVTPAWGRYVAAVLAELADLPGIHGIDGDVSTDIPVGAGLSSSAALEVAVALSVGARIDPLALAQRCQRAEQRATGVPTGIMDQLCIAGAVDGHALLIDCRSFETTPVPVPDDVEVVVRFVAHRTLEGSPYTDRVAECGRAEAEIGPLRDATLDDVAGIADPVVRARARHVVSENQRVVAFAQAMRSGDHVTAGRILLDGHRSLAEDYAVSTPTMDAAVEALAATPGVHGARMTGGGFGGCVVAWCEPGAPVDGWRVHPVGGAAID